MFLKKFLKKRYRPHHITLAVTALFVFVGMVLPHAVFAATGGCSAINPASWGVCLAESLGELLQAFGKLIANAGAAFLDISLQVTLDSSLYNAAGIKLGWEVFRDLANMGFIFILLYIAFMTVLQIGGVQTKRLIASVIIVALLVNFSFFATGFVIDVGNVIGSFIYQTLTPGGVLLGTTLSEGLNITELQNAPPGEFNGWGIFVFHFFAMIFLMMAGFVFIAAGLLFVQRTVMLILVLVSAPFAFVAAILPAGQTLWKKWVGALVGNTFAVSVFLVLISVIVIITANESIFSINSLSGVRGNLASSINVGSGGTGLQGSAGAVINFAVLIGLLVAAHKASQAAAGGLSSFASKAAGKITGYGLGAAGYAGRKFIGGGARKFMENKAISERLGKSKLGRHIESGLSKTATSSFDLRNVDVVAKAAGAAGVTLDPGGGKGGNLAAQERRMKRYTDQEKRFKDVAEKPTKVESRELAQIKKQKEEYLAPERENLKEAEKEHEKENSVASRQAWLAAQDKLRKKDEEFKTGKIRVGNSYLDLPELEGGENMRLGRQRNISDSRGGRTRDAYASSLDRRAGPTWFVSRAQKDVADEFRRGTSATQKLTKALQQYTESQQPPGQGQPPQTPPPTAPPIPPTSPQSPSPIITP